MSTHIAKSRVQKLISHLQLNPVKIETFKQTYEKLKMKFFEKGINSFHLFIISLSTFIILSRDTNYKQISELLSLSSKLISKYYLINLMKQENLADKSIGTLLLTVLDTFKENIGLLELVLNIYIFIICIDNFHKGKNEQFQDIELNTKEKDLLKLSIGSFFLIYFLLSKVSIYQNNVYFIFRLIGHVLTIQSLFQKVIKKVMTKESKDSLTYLYNDINYLSFQFLSNFNEINSQERYLNFAFLGYQMFLLSLLKA